MSEPTFRCSFPSPDVALLELDLPGKSMNVLSRSVLRELEGHLTALLARTDLAGLILASAKPASFVAGADVKEFAQRIETSRDDVLELCRHGQTLFRLLATAPFPTVAAIHGLCLGGGAELAIWCDARVLTRHEKTEFGFPEVKLGLVPAWGGTVRTPRLIGLANAVELITSGQPVAAERAFQLGLAGDIVPPEQLRIAAEQMVRRLRENNEFQRLRAACDQPCHLSPTEQAFLAATASARIQQETGGHYPAPAAALELMLETSALPVDMALRREAETFAGLFGAPTNRALLNVFLLTDRLKKASFPGDDEAAPLCTLAQAGVIGAGIMGAGIAAANLERDLPTTLLDISPEALAAGARGILEEVAYDKHTRQSSARRAIVLGSKLHTAATVASLRECDLVVEGIVEQLDAKTALYAQLEDVLADEAVIGTNTSTIPIARLAEKLRHPSRLCGIHFFNPVRRMQLVEIVRGPATSAATLATAVAYVRRIGKYPLVVNDSPGFLVNRLLSPYLNASLDLLSQGVSIAEIDGAAVRYGMPLGPMALYDMVGLDTAFHAGKVMWEAFPKRFLASPLLPALMKAGRLGQKNGLGFYSYRNPQQRPQADPTLLPLLETYTKTKRDYTPEQITLRLMLPMLLEATRVLEEQIVADARDVDAGLIYGLGFPAFRGGLLYWADSLGAAKLQEMLQTLADLGKPLADTALLQDVLQGNRRFYEVSSPAP